MEIEPKWSSCVLLKDILQIYIETEPRLLFLCLPNSISIYFVVLNCSTIFGYFELKRIISYSLNLDLGMLTAWGCTAANWNSLFGLLLNIRVCLNANVQFQTYILAYTWTFLLIFQYSFLSLFSLFYILFFLFLHRIPRYPEIKKIKWNIFSELLF